MSYTSVKNRKTSSAKPIKSLKSFKSFAGSQGKVTEQTEDQGLGRRFFDKLLQSKDKIHQVDATTGMAETNGSVRLRSIQVAMEMKHRGLLENDIVVIICTKTYSELALVILATLMIGAIVAPLDPEIDIEDFTIMVRNLKPKMAFCDVRSGKHFESVIKNTELSRQCLIVVFGHTDKLSFDKFLKQKPNLDFKPYVVKDTKRKVAFIVPTQGTTGCSKLVCISHSAISIQIANYGSTLIMGAERVLSFFPLSWITEVIIYCYCFEMPLTRIIPATFSERTACKLIHDLRVDYAFLGTDYTMRIIHHSAHEDYDISCLKGIFVGGIVTTPLDMSIIRHSFSRAKVVQCYGMTEMSGIVASFRVDDYESALIRPGSAGLPFPGVKIKILDFETKENLGPDWWGEVVIAGPTLMLGYFKDLPDTNTVFEKGYFRTGDVGQWDSDGFLYIQGRLSDHLISPTGTRYYPSELEDIILMHPAICETVVLGNAREVVACVVKDPSTHVVPEDLMKFVGAKLPESKRPTKIKFLESFPKTSIGKIRKGLLRQMLFGMTIVHSKSVATFDANTNKSETNINRRK